jgi:hypothetical protein
MSDTPTRFNRRLTGRAARLNARFQPLPEAGAQWTLLAVGCKPLFGESPAERLCPCPPTPPPLVP